MDKFTQNYVDRFMNELVAHNPGEKNSTRLSGRWWKV